MLRRGLSLTIFGSCNNKLKRSQQHLRREYRYLLEAGLMNDDPPKIYCQRNGLINTCLGAPGKTLNKGTLKGLLKRMNYDKDMWRGPNYDRTEFCSYNCHHRKRSSSYILHAPNSKVVLFNRIVRNSIQPTQSIARYLTIFCR
jgi:hypothetical protein